MGPEDCKLTDPDTGRAPTTWERVEELLFELTRGEST